MPTMGLVLEFDLAGFASIGSFLHFHVFEKYFGGVDTQANEIAGNQIVIVFSQYEILGRYLTGGGTN